MTFSQVSALREAPSRASYSAALAGVGRTTSTGVGLANIRDRLSQAYGEDHRFEIRNPPEGGFTVIIEIPYESAEPATLGVAAKLSAQEPVTAPQLAPRSIGNAA